MATKARKVSNEDKEKCRIETPTFRVSYPHVFKPQAMPGTSQEPKYSVTMLFDKDQDLKVIKRAIKQAKLNHFGSEDNWPEEIKSPVGDGDSKKNREREGYPGHWVVKAASNQDQKPGVVDKSGTKLLTTASEFYPGCYARAKIFAYVWEFPKNSGNFGVGFILDHVQFVKDGDPFGGREAAIGAFAPVESDDDEDDSESDDSDDESEDF